MIYMRNITITTAKSATYLENVGSYRKYIEQWESQFPGRLILRKYERTALESNDIVEDFLLHSLGMRNVELKPAVEANETMSAEAAAMMQHYQSVHQPNSDDIPTREKFRFRRKLSRFDSKILPRMQPKLHSELIQYIDNSSSDLLWLRDQHEISFETVDYDQIGRFVEPTGDFEKVSDFLEIDTNRLRKLQFVMEAPWWKRIYATRF